MKLGGTAVLGTGAALSLGLALTGCGSSTAGKTASAPTPSNSSSSSASPSSSPSASVSATPSRSATASASGGSTGGSGASAGPGKCTTSDLTAALVEGSPGAGQRYATIVLTNRSTAKCTVYGYGGMQLLTADNKPVPTTMVRVQPAPKTNTLAPGGAASSQLHWTAIPGAGEPQTAACEPTADHALVTPPDETHSITVHWSLGAVCNKGTIQQQPYVAGTGG